MIQPALWKRSGMRQGVRQGVEMLRRILHQRDGALTQDLARQPARFGLGQVPVKHAPDAVTSLACGFCSTGCSLDIHLSDGRPVNLTPSPTYPVNVGAACPKGWEALNVLSASDRACVPLLRRGSGPLEPVDWDRALTTLCVQFRAIQRRHGAESVAWLGTGQIATEELALLGSLGKFGMGMLHGDGNTRQCMASAVVAYKESFGFDAPPYTYCDFEESDVIVLVGSNLCIAHPILWERVCRNPHRPEIVVVDPRSTETATAATCHLRIAPKSDLALFYSVAHVLIRNDWVDREFIARHTSGFERFAELVRPWTPEAASEVTGLEAAAIEQFAELIHRGRRVSFWWTMGINQSHQGVRAAQSLINLALMTGNIGRPGTGANSITGQCNAMGSRLFSNTTNLLGGRDFSSAADRAEVAEILGIDARCIPNRGSWPYHRILKGIDEGAIRGLWVICTNPAHSWIDQPGVERLFRKLDFLVVQDMYHSTETARLAHLVLPAAGWGEKEGTMINSERRIGRLKRVARAPGEALADFSIFRLVAEYWGCGAMFDRWSDPASVFAILQQLSAGRPCDFSGIEGYDQLERLGGVQWPCPESPEGLDSQRRLFADGRFYHADGRARFVGGTVESVAEPTCDEYPFVLLTGRGTVAQWHTQTRTGKSELLKTLAPRDLYVEINPTDARRSRVVNGQMVRVVSRRGGVSARALITPTVTAGQLFVPMHYNETNRLTLAQFDPHSHQPSYKHCAVRLETGSSIKDADHE